MNTVDTILVSLVIGAAIAYLARAALARKRGGSCGSSSCGDRCRMSKARNDD